jgi:hypothetical protein
VTTAFVRQTMLQRLPSHASVIVSSCETSNHEGTKGEWTASICHVGPGVTLRAVSPQGLLLAFKRWRERARLSGVAGSIERSMAREGRSAS